ncbi:hypothetical protein KR009_010546, partial [Drosophila setifemur]
MLEIDGQNPSFSSKSQTERKVNPLGKPNKRFLGRTISTAISHNQREKERTQANCRKQLQDLDDRYERRKCNMFYIQNGDTNQRRSRNRSTSRSPNRPRSRSRARKYKGKHHSRKRSSRSRSLSRSQSRSRSNRKKKHKKSKKHRKTKERTRSCSRSSSYGRKPSPSQALPSEMFLNHSKQMALAVAMAYGQVINAKGQTAAKDRESSPLSDIVKELMSDEEQTKVRNNDALSISSSDETKTLLTIDVSSNSEIDTDSSTESSGTKSDAYSCIALNNSTDQSESDNNSDIEIIE